MSSHRCPLGPKIIGKDRHHTVIKVAEALLRKMQQWEEVTRVDPAAIRGVHHSRMGIKIWSVPVGLQVKICGTQEEQMFYVYTRQPGKVGNMLQAAFA